MFEAYVKIGEENLNLVTDIGKGLASFLVVALGGTIVGIIWGYITGFVTRLVMIPKYQKALICSPSLGSPIMPEFWSLCLSSPWPISPISLQKSSTCQAFSPSLSVASQWRTMWREMLQPSHRPPSNMQSKCCPHPPRQLSSCFLVLPPFMTITTGTGGLSLLPSSSAHYLGLMLIILNYY